MIDAKSNFRYEVSLTVRSPSGSLSPIEVSHPESSNFQFYHHSDDDDDAGGGGGFIDDDDDNGMDKKQHIESF